MADVKEDEFPEVSGGKLGQEELLIDAKNFFDSHKKSIGISSKKGEKIIKINFEDLAEHSPKLTENLIEKPEETFQLLELALEGKSEEARQYVISRHRTAI